VKTGDTIVATGKMLVVVMLLKRGSLRFIILQGGKQHLARSVYAWHILDIYIILFSTYGNITTGL